VHNRGIVASRVFRYRAGRFETPGSRTLCSPGIVAEMTKRATR